jgi:hypothetical protein
VLVSLTRRRLCRRGRKVQKDKLIWDDSACGIVCHSKCSEKLPKSCTASRTGQVEVIEGPLRESNRPDQSN